MINAVKDIQYHIKFRKDGQSGRRSVRRREDAGSKFGSSGSDSFQVSEEVTLLSRMGLSWGESDVVVDEYGFRFVLVFRKREGEATITCLKHNEAATADFSAWIQVSGDERSHVKKELIDCPDQVPAREMLTEDVLKELDATSHALSDEILEVLLASAFVYWKVSLSKSQKAAMRAVDFPFSLYKVRK